MLENVSDIKGNFAVAHFTYGGSIENSVMQHSSLVVKSHQIPWVWILALPGFTVYP